MSKLTHFGKTLLNNATKSIEKDLKKRSKEITIDDISSILINSIDTIKNMKPTIVKPDSAKALKDNDTKAIIIWGTGSIPIKPTLLLFYKILWLL